MTKKTALDAFAAAIESETHITLSPDAMQRVILHLASNTVDPSTLRDIKIVSDYAQIALANTANSLRRESHIKIGTAEYQKIGHQHDRESKALAEAAATMLRQVAVTKLIAEQLMNISSPWQNEQGMPVLPPSAKEWAAMGVEVAAMRKAYEEQEEALNKERSKELIVTTQEIECDNCKGMGFTEKFTLDGFCVHHRCIDCEGTGKREIEIARNQPVPTQEPDKDAAELWEAKVKNNGYNPTPRRAFIDGYLYATANAED